MTYPNRRLLVNATWLQEHLEEDSLLLLDVRAGDNLLAYREGHIPRALPFSLNHAQALVGGTPSCLDERALERQLAALGLEPGQTVVLYDRGLSTTVSYCFWALERIGQRDVRVLDGGLAAWRDAGGALTAERPVEGHGSYRGAPRDCLADAEWIHTHAAQCQLLDARSRQTWRAGTIEGAINLAWRDLVSGDLSTPRLRPAGEIARLLEECHLERERDTVAFCLTGRQASFVYFALRLMGWDQVRLYDGSMLDWLLHDRPVWQNDTPPS